MPDHVPLAVEELTPSPEQAVHRREIGAPPWEAYYLAVYVVCAAIVEFGPLSPVQRILASIALGLLLPWYVLLGRPVMVLDEAAWEQAQHSWRGPVYLTGVIVLFAVVQVQDNNAWFLAFVLTAQCFHVTSIRRGMVFVIVLNVTAGAIVAIQHPEPEALVDAAGLITFSIGFAYVYSRFTARVIHQSLERAVLIEQLTSTRHELAAVHHEAGVLAERHRLAGEIHDTLAQGFTSIVTLIQAAGPGLRPEQGDTRRLLDLALATARDNLAEARALVAALSPVDLTGELTGGLPGDRLGDALCRVAEATAAEAGIGADAVIEGTVRSLPTGTEVVLLRVCQEALANVRKHARASTVRVRLCYDQDVVRLKVADDGCGFASERLSERLSERCSEGLGEAANGGYGLRGMRDRVQQVGGSVLVTSVPGAGTEILAEVPG
jgi:signal transduction histidine kinase